MHAAFLLTTAWIFASIGGVALIGALRMLARLTPPAVATDLLVFVVVAIGALQLGAMLFLELIGWV